MYLLCFSSRIFECPQYASRGQCTYLSALCASLAEFSTAVASVGATLGGLGDHWRAMKERDFQPTAQTSTNFPTCLVSASSSSKVFLKCVQSVLVRRALVFLASCNLRVASTPSLHLLPCAVFNCKPFPANFILPSSGETLIWASGSTIISPHICLGEEEEP